MKVQNSHPDIEEKTNTPSDPKYKRRIFF